MPDDQQNPPPDGGKDTNPAPDPGKTGGDQRTDATQPQVNESPND